MNRLALYILLIVITLSIQTGIFYWLTLYITTVRFFDLMFLLGFFYFFLSLILSSQGGILSHMSQNTMMRSMPAAMQSFHEKRELATVRVNPFLMSSFLFFLTSIVLSVVYW